LVVFTVVRFAHGLLMNITGLVRMYLMENMPPSQGNQVLVLLSIIYTMATILMSWSCGRITLMMDWRLEAFLWCSVPLVVGLVIAFPNWRSVMQSFAIEKVASHAVSHEDVAVENVSASNRRDLLALAVGFLACDCGFYGLTYSAGQLGEDAYLSSMLLCSADIFGYLLALGADKYGRNNTQTCAFLLAGICLFYCSRGEAGSFFVLSAAVVGRLCLDVCFTTVYLGLAEIFSGSGSKGALATCETAARFGGIIAPLSGTLPPSISCSIFATVCLAAAGFTMTLPEKAAKNSGMFPTLRSVL